MKLRFFIFLVLASGTISAQSTNSHCINSFISDVQYSKLLYDSLVAEKLIDTSIYQITIEDPFLLVSFSDEENSLYELCDIVVNTRLDKQVRIELNERRTLVPSSKIKLMLSNEVLLYRDIEYPNQRLKPTRKGKLILGDEIVIAEIIDFASSYKFEWWTKIKFTLNNKTYIGWIPETSEAICKEPNKTVHKSTYTP